MMDGLKSLLGRAEGALDQAFRYGETLFASASLQNVPMEHGIPFYGKTNRAFRRDVVRGWQSVPLSMRHFLVTNRFRIYGARLTTDIPASAQIHPGQKPFAALNAKDFCAYDPETNIGLVTEFYLQDGVCEQKKRSFSFSDALAGVWENNLRGEYAVRRVMYEALNTVFDEVAGLKISDSPAFIAAYNKDLDRLGAFDASMKPEYRNFVTAPDGRQQLFVEQAACAPYPGGSFQAMIRADWKHTAAYVNDFQKAFAKAYRHGPDHPDFQTFLTRLGHPDGIS
jgi:hypothetical protein